MNPDVTITKRTAICGSSITLDLNISESKISQVGLDIKACALGQASACVFVTHAIGAEIGIITRLRKKYIENKIHIHPIEKILKVILKS